MKTNASLRSFLRNIYGYAFFNKFMLISPVYAVFMQDHGMSDMQLSLLFIFLSVATIGTQIPATWLTNKLGRKNTVMFGQLLKSIGFVTWLVWPTFLGFALGMLLWGAMTACFNTAFEGMIYDELRARHHNHIYARVLGTRFNVQAAGAGLAACGSLLMFLGYEWITMASLLSIALSVICIARIKLQSQGCSAPQCRPRRVRVFRLFKNAFRICRTMPCIFLMMILCQMTANFSYVDEYLSPIGLEIGLPVAWVGLMQFFVLMCMMLGQTFAYRFAKIKDWVLYSTICALGGCFILFALDYSLIGLWAFGLSYVLSNGLFVLQYSRFQDFVPTTHRTVMLSVYSMSDNMFYMLMCLVMGLGGSLGSWRYSMFAIGTIEICIGLWALLFIGDKCSIKMNPNKRAIKAPYQIGSDVV